MKPSKSDAEPWRLVLGYGSPRRWRRIAGRVCLLSLLCAPVSCYLAEYRRMVPVFGAIASRLKVIEGAMVDERLARSVPEVAFAVIDVDGHANHVRGNVELFQGLDLARDAIAREAATRAGRTHSLAATSEDRGHGILVFAPAGNGTLHVAALRPSSVTRATGVARANTTFDFFDTAIGKRLEPPTQGQSINGILLTFPRKIRAFDRTWTIYQTHTRSQRDTLLAPDFLPWLVVGLLAGTAWLAGLRRRKRPFELGSAVLDTLVDVVLIVNPDGTIVYASPSAAQRLGYDAPELQQRPFSGLFKAEDQAMVTAALQACQTDNAVAIERARIQTKEGAWRSVSGGCRRIVIDQQPLGFVVTLHDITNLLGLERQLQAAERVQSLGRVAANVAHEFRNTLMAVNVNLEIIERTPDSSKIPGLVETIRRSTRRGSGIVEEIGRFSSPAPLSVAPIDAERWLASLEQELRPLLPPQIALATEVTESLVFQGDEDRLSQVITNLVLNARDAIGERGHVHCTASRSQGGNFTFGIVPAGHFAHIVVRDDGPGIPPEMTPRIFEPLFTTKPKGTGLGLAISQRIVAAHGGLLFAESGGGQGTEMHIFVPMAG